MPQMLQEHLFFFSFLRFLDTCIFSVSHNISWREKAQSDSGAPQSEKNRNLDIMKPEQLWLVVQFSKNKHPFNHKMI